MGMLSKVITFTKDTDGTGPQVVTGVGFEPRAVIFWGVNTVTDGAARSDVRSFIGFAGKDASNVIADYCISWGSDSGPTTSNASRKVSSKAITHIEWGETLLTAADVTSFDSDGFTLDWTTNNGTAYRIMALCLGGSSLVAAKAFTWNTPGSTGNQATTGMGFEPDCLLVARTNGTTTTGASAAMSFGASDGTSSWLVSMFDQDALGTSSVSRGQRTGQIIGSVDSTAAWTTLASLVSFDADGFTLNWSARTNTNPCIGLALQGGDYTAGTTAKSSSTSVPVTQTISGLGYEPSAVLNVSVFGGTLTGAGTNHCPLSIGASGGRGTSLAVGATRQEDGSGSADNQSVHDTDAVIKKYDTGANTILAEAEQVSTSDGFSWVWTTNDAVGSNIAWLAFGPHETPVATSRNSQVVMVG